MKKLSVTQVARNFSAVLDAVERDQEGPEPVYLSPVNIAEIRFGLE